MLATLSRRRLVRWFTWVVLGLSGTGVAADAPLVFDDPRLEDRYRTLLEELRCLVCQNQNLADSHASLAQDLRQEVYEKVRDGASEEEVVGYLVARYGDFVRYRPAFKTSTLALWLGPVVIIGGGAMLAWRTVRSHRPDGHPGRATAARSEESPQ